MSKVKIEINGVTQEFELSAKTFKTGSTGFHAMGKLKVSDTERYQLNILAVLIGSKPRK